MIYLYAFLFSGFVCAIGQIILDNTKLSAGHITSLFTAVGALLSFFGVYPWLIKKCGAGASILILNFGNMLYQSGYEGLINEGFFGIFSNLLLKSSLAISSVIFFSFLFTLFFKPRD